MGYNETPIKETKMTNLTQKAVDAAKAYRRDYVRNVAVVTARVVVVTAVVAGAAYASHKIKEAHRAN
jgi:hypothetical protein